MLGKKRDFHYRVNERLDVPGGEERKDMSNNVARERRLQAVTAVTKKEADDWLAKCRRNLETDLSLDNSCGS